MAFDSLKLCCIFFALCVIAVILDERIRCGDFEHIYNHWPENCTSYSLNGSEDIALFPNQQAVISSGLYFWEFEGIVEKPIPKMYMFDFKKSEQGPIELAMDVDQKDFNPHGVGHWVSAEGDYIIYVVSHQKERDTVESFYFNGEDKSLQHRRSIQHPLLRQMNDLVVVGLDEFYVTTDHYFSHPALQKMEFILRLPLCSVVYFNQDTAKRVAAGLTLANGIAKSNNGRFIYVSNLRAREVVVYKRYEDNTLQYVQDIPLQYAVDNIYIDPKNGHMWVAVFPHVLDVMTYLHDRSHPVRGRILHISLSEQEEEPFSSKSQIEEIFETSGSEFGGMSIGIYCNRKLLIGTIRSDLMLCDGVHTSY